MWGYSVDTDVSRDVRDAEPDPAQDGPAFLSATSPNVAPLPLGGSRSEGRRRRADPTERRNTHASRCMLLQALAPSSCNGEACHFSLTLSRDLGGAFCSLGECVMRRAHRARCAVRHRFMHRVSRSFMKSSGNSMEQGESAEVDLLTCSVCDTLARSKRRPPLGSTRGHASAEKCVLPRLISSCLRLLSLCAALGAVSIGQPMVATSSRSLWLLHSD